MCVKCFEYLEYLISKSYVYNMNKQFSIVFFTVVIGFFCTNGFSQHNKGYEQLMSDAKSIIFEKPSETIPYFLKANEIANGSDDLDKIAESSYWLSIAYIETEAYDLAMRLINSLLLNYEEELPDEDLSRLYNLLGGIYYDKDSYDIALEHYLKALEFAKAIKNDQNIGQISMNIGNILRIFDENDKAYKNYQEALNLAKSTNDTIGLVYVYNTLGEYYSELKNYSEADLMFQKSLLLSKQKKFTIGLIKSSKKSGVLAIEMNRLELAEGYFKSIIDNPEISDYDKAEVIIKMGVIEELRNDSVKAIDNYKRALQLGNNIPSLDIQTEASKKLYKLYEQNGEFETALTYYKLFQKSHDSIYNAGIAFKLKATEMEYDFKHQKEIKAKTSTFFKIMMILIILSFIFLVYMFYLRNRKQKLIIENNELQIQLNEEREEQLKQDISAQNNEIIQKVLRINSEDSFKKNLLEDLVQLKELPKTDFNSKLKSIINDIKLSDNENFWDEFKMHFNKVHPEFYKTLIETHPNLTPNERKLCGYIRLNMSIKEISQLTKQTTNSIKIARTRLRRKLELTGKKQSIVEYLSAF